MDYVYPHTDDYKLACQATNELCGDVQRIIWEKSQKYDYENIVCPGAPRKGRRNPRFAEERLQTLVGNGEKDGVSQLYKRMKLLAYQEFQLRDFKRDEYESYCLILYKTMMNEIEYERLNLKYRAMFGDKWSTYQKKMTKFYMNTN